MQCGCLLQHGPPMGCRTIPVQSWPLPQAAEDSLLCSSSSSFPNPHVPTAASQWFSSLLFVHHFSFSLFFFVFPTKASPALLMASAVSCGRPQRSWQEPAVSSTGQSLTSSLRGQPCSHTTHQQIFLINILCKVKNLNKVHIGFPKRAKLLRKVN